MQSLNAEPVDGQGLRKLAAALAHRGPDGEGLWTSTDQTTGLVHRRLAIIDTSDRAHQPMVSHCERYAIVFNGEIYNFLELRDQLAALGSRFRTDSDTEVILESWRHWGESMFSRFNGMWALALKDNYSGDLVLARDRFGVKPLLYAMSRSTFAFASEMKTFRVLPWVDGSVDHAVAARLLFDPFSVEGSDRSLVSAVRRLPAGHLAVLSNGELRLQRWWRTTDHLVEVPRAVDERIEEFRALFFDSVKLRMRSDVPVGTCLSGGFDSSAIVGVMAAVSASVSRRAAADWRHAFIASFPGKANDETTQALEAAEYAHVTPHIVAQGDANALDNIDTVLEDLDDIYIGLPSAPWLVYRELRRANTVVSLDGHGADELMGGYRQANQAFSFALRNLINMASAGAAPLRSVTESSKAAWLSARGLNFIRGHRLTAPAPLSIPAERDELPGKWGPMNRRLYRMFHSTVLPTILRNFDRLSMAHGIEIRMPFMDWRLVTYTMSLPDAAKSGDGYTKLVARQALAGAMPESIRLARNKVGFNSPMPEWLNDSLGNWALNLLKVSNAEFSSLVDEAALVARVHDLTSRRAWDWHSAGRLWPYIHLKWYLSRQ
jgi:asparagine synthase (glutamine-hydrolysing)